MEAVQVRIRVNRLFRGVNRLFGVVCASNQSCVHSHAVSCLLLLSSSPLLPLPPLLLFPSSPLYVQGELTMLLPSDKGVIHPTSKNMQRWDLLIILLLVYVGS